MAIVYKYKTIKRPDESEVKSPSIPITLRGKHFFDTVALIDSGADVSAMNEDTAKILGIDLSGKGEEVRGIGGPLKACLSSVNIIIEKKHEKYNFPFLMR